MKSFEERELNKELDNIQRDIWARINEELQAKGIKMTIPTAYSAGQSIQFILHPRIKKLCSHLKREVKKEILESYFSLIYKELKANPTLFIINDDGWFRLVRKIKNLLEK